MKKKILIISNPGFENGFKQLSRNIEHFSIEVISFKNKLWIGKSTYSRIKFLKEYDAVHFFWANRKFFDLLMYRIFAGVKIINHFIGSDFYFNIKKKSFRKLLELKLCSFISEFLVVGDILEKEMIKFGYKSQRIDFINQDIKEREISKPRENKIVVYLPSDKKKFFRFNQLVKLANDFPETKFIWFPFKKEEDLSKNIIQYERLAKEQVFEEMETAKIFIRLAEHDGLPNTVIEALNVGCHVIWTFDMPFVNKIHSYDELKSDVENLLKKEEINKGGIDYVIEKFNRKKIKEDLLKFYEKL